MSKRDYYDVLGVPKDADDAALKSAFHKQAMLAMLIFAICLFSPAMTDAAPVKGVREGNPTSS